MGPQFILVEYNNVPYPEGYQSNIKEVAGYFDKDFWLEFSGCATTTGHASSYHKQTPALMI